jgi:uncharacterized coiled-coil protein SlyX
VIDWNRSNSAWLFCLEWANTRLSDAIIQQQQQLKTLRAALSTLLQRMEAAQSQSAAWAPQDEKPRHC